MAAVESISEVIKDSDKEHVPSAMSGIENDKMNLVNGDTDRKRYVKFLYYNMCIRNSNVRFANRIFCS